MTVCGADGTIRDFRSSKATRNRNIPERKGRIREEPRRMAYWNGDIYNADAHNDTEAGTVGKTAATHLGRDGKPDHTVFSYGGLRRSFDSDKGQNVRDEHYAENGVRGSSVDREPER